MPRSDPASEARPVMKTTTIVLVCALIAASAVCAQVGNVSIPTGAEITIPLGATFCADTIFANHPGFGTLTYPNANNICRAVVIPVELLTVSAEYGNGTVALRWTTASERNCAGFEVQRLAAGTQWRAVGHVPGHGTTTREQAYGFVDVLSADLRSESTLRYRLRQIDHDGTSGYSPVVDVMIGIGPGTVQLHAAYPNPASDLITVRYSLPETMTARIAVYSMVGQEVIAFTGSEFSSRGEHLLSVRTALLPPGAYLIELRGGETRLVRHFVVRR